MGLMLSRKKYQWLLLCIVILAIILLPFFLFGNRIEIWVNNFIQSASNRPGLTAIVLFLLLASDILLPIPANEANTAAGFLLGFPGGLVTSFIGRTIGCMIGFLLGVKFGRSIARRLVGDNELKQLEIMSQRFGDWVIIILRPAPVLAEASVLFAGISKMSAYRFLLLTTVANLGVSAVFSAVGAFSATVNSFVLAFAACIFISLVAMVIMRKREKIKPKLRTEFNMKEKQITNEWTGIKGKIGACFLNSPLRRLETLFLGDYRTAFLNEVSRLITGGSKIVLDVGAGSGYFSLAIAKKLSAGKVICLDLSEVMLERLERKAEREGIKDRIQILKTEASSTGLEDESVDLVVSNFVFHELSSPEAVLLEMLRILKINGWIIITDFRRDTWIGRRIAVAHKGDAHGPFSVSELDSLFVKVGLSNVKVSSIKNFILGVGKK